MPFTFFHHAIPRMSTKKAASDEAPLWYGMLLSGSFVVMYSAILTVQNLLSSTLDEKLALNSLGLLYFALAFGNLFSSEVVASVSPKRALFCGSTTYILWMGSATLAAHKKVEWLIYVCSFLVGLGGAVMWGAQYAYLARNCPPHRIGRWQGVFFFGFGFSPIIGQGIALLFTNVFSMEKKTLFIYMTGLGTLGSMSLLLTRRRPDYLPPLPVTRRRSLKEVIPSLIKAINLMRRLVPLFVVFGLCQPYFFGVLTSKMKYGIAIQSLLIGGVGAVLGSYTLARLSDRYRRSVIMLTLAVHITACVLSVFAIHNANNALFRLSLFFYGISEGGFNTQCRSSIAALFPAYADQGGAVFLLFFALAGGTGFFYGTHISPFTQAWIIIGLCLLAGLSVFSLPLNPPRAPAAAPTPTKDMESFAAQAPTGPLSPQAPVTTTFAILASPEPAPIYSTPPTKSIAILSV